MVIPGSVDRDLVETIGNHPIMCATPKFVIYLIAANTAFQAYGPDIESLAYKTFGKELGNLARIFLLRWGIIAVPKWP